MELARLMIFAAALGTEPAGEISQNMPVSVPARADAPPAADPVKKPPADNPAPSATPSVPANRFPIPISGGPQSRQSRFQKPQEEVAPESEKSTGSPRQLAWWTTTGLGLAVVLCAIFLGGRLLKRMVPGATWGKGGGPVHVLHRSFVTPKHSVCLLRCGHRIMILGVSGDRMQTLGELHDPEEIDFVRGQCMQVRPQSTSRAFRDVMGRDAKDAAADEGPAFAQSTSASAPNAARDTRATGFADHLAALRDRIGEWKSRARAT